MSVVLCDTLSHLLYSPKNEFATKPKKKTDMENFHCIKLFAFVVVCVASFLFFLFIGNDQRCCAKRPDENNWDLRSGDTGSENSEEEICLVVFSSSAYTSVPITVKNCSWGNGL